MQYCLTQIALKQSTNSSAHLVTYDCTFATVKIAIITLKMHSRNINEVKHVKAYIREKVVKHDLMYFIPVTTILSENMNFEFI